MQFIFSFRLSNCLVCSHFNSASKFNTKQEYMSHNYTVLACYENTGFFCSFVYFSPVWTFVVLQRLLLCFNILKRLLSNPDAVAIILCCCLLSKHLFQQINKQRTRLWVNSTSETWLMDIGYKEERSNIHFACLVWHWKHLTLHELTLLQEKKHGQYE